jgi:hypothetical protein
MPSDGSFIQEEMGVVQNAEIVAADPQVNRQALVLTVNVFLPPFSSKCLTTQEEFDRQALSLGKDGLIYHA